MIIYEIKNKINNKPYVGQYSKCDTKEEFQQTNYWGSGIYIKRAIKKYGVENFERSVLVENISDINKINYLEVLWIKEKNSKHPNGYNLTNGGEGINGYSFSDKSKKVMSEKKQGKHLSPNTEFKKGKQHRYYGKNRPEMSIRMKGEKNPSAKPVLLISPEGKEYLLSCYVPFCKKYDLTKENICKVLRGQRNHHKGWTGKYL
ncbi:MAG: hypothetical protein WC495_07230 [Patescibacteria group bacterium]|jgi:group I intron endonuclease